MTISDKIALVSLFVAGLSFFLTIVTIRQTRKHNHLSVRPILEFIPVDFIGHLTILIKNSGTGPLIRQDLRCTDGKRTKNYLIDLMPRHPTIKWTNFSKFDKMVISPNDNEILIELKGDESDEVFKAYITEVRKVLMDTKLTCSYRDIYGQDFKVENFDLNYCFERHFNN